MAWNLVGAVAIIAWSAFFSFVVFGTLKSLRLFRVDRLVELRGENSMSLQLIHCPFDAVLYIYY